MYKRYINSIIIHYYYTTNQGLQKNGKILLGVFKIFSENDSAFVLGR